MNIPEVQRKTGAFVGNGGTTTALDAATTAGNVVVILVASDAAITTPTGFNRHGPAGSFAAAYSKATSGGETTFTFPAPGASCSYVYDVIEVKGIDPLFPVDVVSPTVGNVNTNSAATMPRSATYDGWAVACWQSRNTTTTIPTGTAQTGGFVQDTTHGVSDGATATALTTASQSVAALATYASTLTVSNATSSESIMVVFTAIDAPVEPVIAQFWVFPPELAGIPMASLTTGITGTRFIEAVTSGTPTIDSNGLLLSSSGAACRLQMIPSVSVSSTGSRALVRKVRLRFNTARPTANSDLVAVVAGGGNVVVRYVLASQKLGLTVAGGTEQVSDQAVPVDTWMTVEVRTLGNSTAWTGDWRVDYGDGNGPIDQPQASGTASGVLSGPLLALGWNTVSTASVSIAYDVTSIFPGHYRMGEFEGRLLGPDPAATPTVSGTVGSFALMTANATGAALTSGTLAAARNAIDDWPPTFGGSADGAIVTTASATDYLEVGMASVQAAPNFSIRAVKALAPIWAASGTAATIRLIGFDGTTAVTLYAEADPGSDNSATPAWACALWRPANGWTQAMLDAAALRVGSNDATPDIGVHALGLLVLLQTANTAPVFGSLATATLDPVTGGVLGMTVTPPVGYDTTLHYEESGSPTEVGVTGGDTHTETIDAPDAPTTNYIAAYPAAEPDPIA
jgi:hypothetical protein